MASVWVYREFTGSGLRVGLGSRGLGLWILSVQASGLGFATVGICGTLLGYWLN